MKRVFLIVLDSVGIGAMDDAAEFGDAGTNTLRSASEGSCFHMPNMEQLGLFNIDGIDWKKGVENPKAVYGRSLKRKGYHDRPLGDCGFDFQKATSGLSQWVSKGDPG